MQRSFLSRTKENGRELSRNNCFTFKSSQCTVFFCARIFFYYDLDCLIEIGSLDYFLACDPQRYNNHKSTECTKVKAKSERRDILRSKQLCFNCTRAGRGVLIVLVKVPARIAKQNITLPFVKRNETKNIESF